MFIVIIILLLLLLYYFCNNKISYKKIYEEVIDKKWTYLQKKRPDLYLIIYTELRQDYNLKGELTPELVKDKMSYFEK